MDDSLDAHKHEILHLMIWLTSQPPAHSTAYIQEALQHAMQELNLSEEEVKYFADQIQMADIVLGKQLPQDPKARAVYDAFMNYLLRIKNQ